MPVTSEAEDCVSQNEGNNYSLWIPFPFESFYSRTVPEGGLQRWWAPAPQLEERNKCSSWPVTRYAQDFSAGKHCDKNETYFNGESHSNHLVFLKCLGSSREPCMNSSLSRFLLAIDSFLRLLASWQQEETWQHVTIARLQLKLCLASECVILLTHESINIDSYFMRLWSMWLFVINQANFVFIAITFLIIAKP